MRSRNSSRQNAIQRTQTDHSADQSDQSNGSIRISANLNGQNVVVESTLQSWGEAASLAKSAQDIFKVRESMDNNNEPQI